MNFSLSRRSEKSLTKFFVEVEKTIKNKLDLLKIYKDEIKKWPHPRSLKSIKFINASRFSNWKKICRSIYTSKRIELIKY